MKRSSIIFSMILLVLLLFPLAHTSIAGASITERITVDDPRGDLYIINVDPGLASTIDVTRLELYYDHDDSRLVIEATTAGEPASNIAYIFELLVEGPGYSAYYRIDAVHAGGADNVAFTLEGHPALQGGLTLIGNQSVATIRQGNTLKILVALDEAYNPFKLEDADYISLSFTLSLVAGQGSIIDEVTYTWSNYDQDTGSEPGTGNAPTDDYAEGPGHPGYTDVYRGLEGNTDGVSVSINGEPTIKIYTVKPNYTSPGYTVIEVKVDGSSSNAHHVAVIIETFVAGELNGQLVLNSYTGSIDDDGPANGYKFYFNMPLQTGLKFEINEDLSPVQGWDKWSLRASYTIPAAPLPGDTSMKSMLDLIEVLEGGDVEVYVTAVAYEDDAETLYDADTEKAQLIIDQPGNQYDDRTDSVETDQTGQETTGEETQQDTTGQDTTGLPVTTIAAAIVVIAVFAVALKKFLL